MKSSIVGKRGQSPVFCPKCGCLMSLLNGAYTCVEGDMPVSPRMQAALAVRFPIRSSHPTDSDIDHHLSRGFCPGCGVPLTESLRCPSCGGSLRDLQYELVELHPHRGVDNRSRGAADA